MKNPGVCESIYISESKFIVELEYKQNVAGSWQSDDNLMQIIVLPTTFKTIHVQTHVLLMH